MAEHTRLAVTGALVIAGGEALCRLAPLRYEHVVLVACPITFFVGVALVTIGAIGRIVH